MTSETKEDFCGACLGGAVAIAGAGVAGYGASSRSREKGRKKILVISGIITMFISVMMVFYFIMIVKCDSCR
jgi:ABC-type maltose transport system permease subunit